MIIARSGTEAQDFKPRQPKRLPKDWSKGSPDAAVLTAAGRYSAGLARVNAFTAKDATTLDLCSHSLLLVSLESLAELHRLLTREKHIGHRWTPLGPPAEGDAEAARVADRMAASGAMAAAGG